jgi:predicted transposase YbfD/YdcC
LKEAITEAFAGDQPGVQSPWHKRLERREQQTVTTVNKGHGRIEQRTLTSTTALNEYLDWPGVQQVLRLERRRTIKGKHTTEIAYGITSLARTQADAAALLALVRGHWSIENNLFGVRDTTFGEDACRVRTGHAPQNLAAIRNVAISLLNRIDCSNKAATLRRHAARPQEAIALIRDLPEN